MVVAVLLALMDHLPQDLCSPAAVRFLPALNEVCCFNIHITDF